MKTNAVIPEKHYDIETDDDTREQDSPENGGGLYPYDPTYEDIDLKEDPQSVFQYVRKYKQGKLIINPDFQRNLVWKLEQKSQFIESIILNFPLPPFYVNQDKPGNWIIIDGLQRTTTLIEFLDDEFELTELNVLPKLNGERFSTLPSELQTKIEDKKLLIFILKPSTPIKVIYDLFNRINTGGTLLNRQEVRNCIYKGKSTKLLKELAEQDYFKEAIENSISPKRMRDREAILRYLSFKIQDYTAYEGDMSNFVESAMKKINQMSDKEISNLKKDFKKVMLLTLLFFGDKNFRIPTNNTRGKINIAMLESISYFFSNTPDEIVVNNQDVIVSNFQKLTKNIEYIDAVKSSTGTKYNVQKRFKLAMETLGSNLA